MRWPKRTLAERLAERIVAPDGPDGCWLWTGALNRGGYGIIARTKQARSCLVHRVVYELVHGPIADGLQIDHLCRVRHCVNPRHIEPVTPRENSRRGENWQRNKTHCKRGHEFKPETTYRSPTGRVCLICAREHKRAWKKRNHPAVLEQRRRRRRERKLGTAEPSPIMQEVR